MAQYIDKADVVAEINRVLSSYDPNEITSGRYALIGLRDFLDTLEVKEADSRLSLEDISILRQIMFDYNRQVKNEMSIPNNEDYCKEILKRFKTRKGK